MLKAYKYRIYPTTEQAAKIDHTISCCRFVYNLALETKIRAYKDGGVYLSAYDLQKQLTELKKDYEWLQEPSSAPLNWAIEKMETAFKKFYKGAGYPKFKNKHSRQSFDNMAMAKTVDWETSMLNLPKIKNVPIRLSRFFDGEIRDVTISKAPTGKYFASILVKTSVSHPVLREITKESSIGLDTGIKSFVISSDGRTYEANRKLKESLQRLNVLKRRASRKKKGSNNRKKANLAVALLYERITNKRKDYIQNVTHELTNDSQVSCICVEDLNIKGIVKNHNLSQAVNDVSFGEFYRVLEYKCQWNGINFVKIGRFEPSSKTCSTCGNINKELKLYHREWTCGNCGTSHDRDFNAAVNIKNFGLKNSGVGSPGGPVELSPLGGALKQESIPKSINSLTPLHQ